MALYCNMLILDKKSCQRCDTSYYCIGDGERYPCGRCEPYDPGSTCGRSPTEHTFGGADECTTCPVGWVSHDIRPWVHESNECLYSETCL